MTLDSLVAALHDTDTMLPLLCSVVAGVVIGVEREFQGKAAGVRTHTLLCFASAILTLVGLRMAEWTSNLSQNTQVVSDLARMPHAILTGVGFLGAGVIFREGASVHGLTTAASLWLTAALGIVFGTGLLELGTIGTAAAVAVLVLLRVLQSVTIKHPALRLEIAVRADSRYDGAALARDLAAQHLKAGPVSRRQDHATGLRHFSLIASSLHSDIDAERLAKALHDEPMVLEFSIIPLENESLAGP
ncbi:MgtC/SapB family protein [Lacimonas salitolerans]|uniref:Protein MgtC n=1 Tax=Lacimonas salitolerans TaxID=1323750 RepID=A0ABW4EHJ3_9RHOB